MTISTSPLTLSLNAHTGTFRKLSFPPSISLWISPFCFSACIDETDSAEKKQEIAQELYNLVSMQCSTELAPKVTGKHTPNYMLYPPRFVSLKMQNPIAL